MTDDERQAHIILSRWIHKVTGTSELERGMRKVSDAFRDFAAAVAKALDPMRDVTSKWDDEYGVVG